MHRSIFQTVAVAAILCCVLLHDVIGAGDPAAGTPIGCVTIPDVMTQCLAFHSGAQSWQAAQKTCIKEGSLLVTLNSAQKEALVREYLSKTAGNMDPDFNGYVVWVGSHTDMNETRWEWVDGHQLDESANASLNFSIPPKDYQDCATINIAGTGGNTTVGMEARQCRRPLHFICQKSVAPLAGGANKTSFTRCQIGPYPGITIEDQCYCVYGNDPDNFLQSWTRADRACRGIGASLASLDHLARSGLSAAALAPLGAVMPGSFWIGLDRQRWIWVESCDPATNIVAGSPLNSSNWVPDPPVDLSVMDCMTTGVYPDNVYGWLNSKCDQLLPFVCEKQVAITTTAAPTTTAAAHTATNATGATDHMNEEEKEELHDWANVIIPCAMIAIIAIAAILSVVCYYRQRRKGYNPQP